MKSSDIHHRAISQEMPQPSITKISLKITYLKFHSNFPGVNELVLTFSIPVTAHSIPGAPGRRNLNQERNPSSVMGRAHSIALSNRVPGTLNRRHSQLQGVSWLRIKVQRKLQKNNNLRLQVKRRKSRKLPRVKRNRNHRLQTPNRNRRQGGRIHSD